MRFSCRFVRHFAAAPLCVAALTALAGVALTPGSARAQVTLPAYFDATPYNGIQAQPPYVGTGSFTFATDPGDGAFTIAALGSISYSFTVGGVTFTQADQDGPDSNLLFVLSTTPTGRRLQFSDNGNYSPVAGGSLEAVTPGGDVLSFEPSYVNAGLNLYYAQTRRYIGGGDYYIGQLEVAAVPEPGAIAFGIIAASSVVGLIARRRR